MTINWGEILQTLLYVVITASVPVVAFYIIKFLNVLFENISVKTDSEYFQDTLNKVLHIVTTVVSSTSQTYVDSLKAEGKFDEEAHSIAFNKTKDGILDLLNDEMKELISVTYGDFNKWLDNEIEAKVRDLKSNN